MAYNMTKRDMVKHLKEDAVYFPFEQIRSFEILQSQPLEISEDTKKDYFAFFKDVKKECERLMRAEPNNENCELWKEAVATMNKILK